MSHGRVTPRPSASRAQVIVAQRLAVGSHGLAKDEKAAFAVLTAAAGGGYPKALYNVAMAYLEGGAYGVEKDPARGVSYLVQAAEAGFLYAQVCATPRPPRLGVPCSQQRTASRAHTHARPAQPRAAVRIRDARPSVGSIGGVVVHACSGAGGRAPWTGAPRVPATVRRRRDCRCSVRELCVMHVVVAAARAAAAGTETGVTAGDGRSATVVELAGAGASVPTMDVRVEVASAAEAGARGPHAAAAAAACVHRRANLALPRPQRRSRTSSRQEASGRTRRTCSSSCGRAPARACRACRCPSPRLQPQPHPPRGTGRRRARTRALRLHLARTAGSFVVALPATLGELCHATTKSVALVRAFASAVGSAQPTIMYAGRLHCPATDTDGAAEGERVSTVHNFFDPLKECARAQKNSQYDTTYRLSQTLDALAEARGPHSQAY